MGECVWPSSEVKNKGGGEGGVSTEINLDQRREPAEIEAAALGAAKKAVSERLFSAAMCWRRASDGQV